MEFLWFVLPALLVVASVVLALVVRAQRGVIERLGASQEQLRIRAEQERTASEAEKAALRADRERAEAEIRSLIEQRTRSESELEALRRREVEREGERGRMEEAFRAQFRNLADEIFGEQSRRFKESNRESLDALLKPFRENISDFRERVERIYSTEREQHGALKNELHHLMQLNQQITRETTNLTQALRGNSKVQGDWGETILDTILESSGLVRGVHYDTQLNLKNAAGDNLRPDVVLYLPEGKQIVIDAKVSLTAYVEYAGAESEADSRRFLAAHVESVRQHVAELGRKEYQRLLHSPDFVIMFIPNEPAFLAALQADHTIWGNAYDKKVVVSSPTNLFALLRIVDDLWRRDDQTRNQAAIVSYGVKLYDQLVAFCGALDGVGKSLDEARSRYDEAYKRLHTGNDNIVRTGERLRKLGLPTKKRQSDRLLDQTDGLDD